MKNYRMCAIITRGLYIFYPLFEGRKLFFREVFSRAGYDGAGTVVNISDF
jgi:hypothetical protein